jgi:phosphoglycolate phosphatase-like HAD superfamily hydrolase
MPRTTKATAPPQNPEPHTDHRAAAVHLLDDTDARTRAIAGAGRELNTQRILAGRVQTERDLAAAQVHALLYIGDQLADLTAAVRSAAS